MSLLNERKNRSVAANQTLITHQSETVKLTNPEEVTNDYRINLSSYHDNDDDEIRIGIKFSTVPPIRPKKKDVVLPFMCQNMGRSVGNLFLFFKLPLWAVISQFQIL